MDKKKSTIWQKWNRSPWYVKTVQFWLVGFAATYLFISAGLDGRLAAIAGLFGINIVIFATIAYLADQDDQKNNQPEQK